MAVPPQHETKLSYEPPMLDTSIRYGATKGRNMRSAQRGGRSDTRRRVWRRVTTAAVLSLSAVLIRSVPAMALGEWTEPEVIVADDHPTRSVDVGIGPDGYAVVVWTSGAAPAVPDAGASPEEESRVWAVVRTPGQPRFGTPQPLSRPGGRSARLAVAPDGQTVVTWIGRAGRLKAAFRDRDAGWSSPQTLAPRPRTPAALDIGGDGTAIATWRGGVGAKKVRAAVRPPRGSFREPETVAKDRLIGVYGPVAAAGSEGRGLVTWSGRCPLADPSRREPTRVARLHRFSRWSNVDVIANSKCPTYHLVADMADDGRATVVISGHLRAWDGIRAAFRPAGESFERADLISRRGEVANFAEVGITRRGTVIVLWQVHDSDGHIRGIRLALKTPHGNFSEPRFVTKGRQSLQDLAVGGQGHAVAVWHALGEGLIEAAYKAPDGWFDDPEAVASGVANDALAHPAVAINLSGDAISAWGRPDPGASMRGVFVSDRAAG
jgi:hypothetical protein